MKYLQGQDRHQTSLFPVSLDEAIVEENEIRLIDIFVDSLKLNEYGFCLDHSTNGRPAYHPADLLKLYIYGYLNKARSSRDLEKECHRNIEVIWLLKGLKPDHNTISNFRRDNQKAYKRRQAIVEHPYGTIKRQWGFNYIITKKYIERAEADFGMVITAYNLRRLINLVGINTLIGYMKDMLSLFALRNALYNQFYGILSPLFIKTKYYHYFQPVP